jgi:hypothetical protein
MFSLPLNNDLNYHATISNPLHVIYNYLNDNNIIIRKVDGNRLPICCMKAVSGLLPNYNLRKSWS